MFAFRFHVYGVGFTVCGYGRRSRLPFTAVVTVTVVVTGRGHSTVSVKVGLRR